jgi:hypothetical protein
MAPYMCASALLPTGRNSRRVSMFSVVGSEVCEGNVEKAKLWEIFRVSGADFFEDRGTRAPQSRNGSW